MSTRNGTTTDDDGDRWYIDPSNVSGKYAGVTSVLNARNKSFLAKAKVNGVAKYAAHNRVALADMTQAAATALLRSQDVVLPDWKAKREFGTAAHRVLENYLAGARTHEELSVGVREVEGTPGFPVANDFTTWVVRCWDEFTAQHAVEVLESEVTLFNDTYGYAGSADLILRVDGKIVIVDTKTNAAGPSGDVALQLMAYRRCERMVDVRTGVSRPMHDIEGAYVLWIQPDGWCFVPVQQRDDVEWKTFYALLLVFAWTKIHDADAVLEPVSGTRALPKKWRS